MPADFNNILTLQMITIDPTVISMVLAGSLPTSFAASGAAITPPMISPTITCQ